MADNYTQYTAFQIMASKYPLDQQNEPEFKSKLPYHEGGSHGEEVYDDDPIRVDSSVVVIHCINENVRQEVYLQQNREEEYQPAHHNQKVQEVNASSFERTPFNWRTYVDAKLQKKYKK